MNNDVFTLILAFLFVILAIIIFIKFSRSLRKGGGSLTTTMLGSTDLFYDKEKKNAIKVIVEKKAGKKMAQQDSEGTKPNDS